MMYDVEQLIPHGKPMIMIDGYCRIDDKRALSEKTFSADDYAVCRGFVMDSVLIECLAQTVAAHSGYNAVVEKKSRPGQGMLVAVDLFDFYDRIAAPATITINIQQKDQFGSFTMYSGTVRQREKTVAKGDIKVFNAREE
ncbi:MAG: hypothetical protein R6V54_03965 [Desulfobacteraceae bacterium]